MCVRDDLIMIIGGDRGIGRGYQGDTYFYDLNKDKWSEGPPLKKGRCAHAAGIVIDEMTKAKIIHNLNTCFLWLFCFCACLRLEEIGYPKWDFAN